MATSLHAPDGGQQVDYNPSTSSRSSSLYRSAASQAKVNSNLTSISVIYWSQIYQFALD